MATPISYYPFQFVSNVSQVVTASQSAVMSMQVSNPVPDSTGQLNYVYLGRGLRITDVAGFPVNEIENFNLRITYANPTVTGPLGNIFNLISATFNTWTFTNGLVVNKWAPFEGCLPMAGKEALRIAIEVQGVPAGNYFFNVSGILGFSNIPQSFENGPI